MKDAPKQILNIMKDTYCTTKYECYKKGIDNFQNIKEIMARDILVCGAEYAQSCPHSLSFGDTYFCKCPLLNYLYKNKK